MTQLPALAQAQQAVATLVKRFARNVEQYRRPEYNEVNVRHEFIEPFFEALGWDVHNRAGATHQSHASSFIRYLTSQPIRLKYSLIG